jgi:hypothetical protein
MNMQQLVAKSVGCVEATTTLNMSIIGGEKERGGLMLSI